MQLTIKIPAEFSYLAFDIIGDLALGTPFGMVQSQKDAAPIALSLAASEMDTHTKDMQVVSILAGGGRSIMSIGIFPSWAQPFLLFLPWNIPGLLDRRNIFGMAVATVNARLRRGSQEGDGREGLDLIDKLLEVRDERGEPLSRAELMAEAFIMLAAGSDTTSN